VGHSKGILKMDVYSHEQSHQKITEMSNNLMTHHKLLEKQDRANPFESSKWKEIIKLRKEINGDQKNYTGNQWNKKLVL
jgi:hypothetical protein